MSHKDKQDFSGPADFVWQELVMVLTEAATTAEDVISQKAHTHYMEVVDSKAQRMLTDKTAKDLPEAKRKVLEMMVHTCRVSKCWNPGKTKVELAVTDTEANAMMEVIIAQLVKMAEGDRKKGAPPKSDIHRKIAKVLGHGSSHTTSK
eukprot:TRINITY_DN53907_c0_g2_i1.p2 TRINITY_DN53907_c0_g2~~TRINITY_DN53907_c0_g2_i1.p2  ORF type:complete len:155 (+),score=53.94 TRINITY_DN53907_c0_g2_i1:22-465(+)